MYLHKKLFFLLFISLLLSQMKAQIDDPLEARVFERVVITIDQNDGSKAIKNLVTLSKDGFLWYTTSNGLVKDYGSDHIIYPIESPDETEVGQFNKIYESKDGSVWLGTTEGLYHFNIETGEGKWIQWRYPESNEVASIIDIIELENGDMVMVTNGQYKLRYDIVRKIMLSYRVPDIYFSKGIPSSVPVTYQVDDLEAFSENKMISKQFNSIFLYRNGKIELFKKYGNKRRLEKNMYGFELVENGTIFPKDSSGHYTYNGIKYAYDYIKSVDRQVMQLPSPLFKGLYSAKKRGGVTEFIAKNRSNVNVLEFYNYYSDKKVLIKSPTLISYDEPIESYHFNTNVGVLFATLTNKIEAVFPRDNNFKTFLTNDVDDVSSIDIISVSGFLQHPNGTMYSGTNTGLYDITDLSQIELIPLSKLTEEVEEDLLYKSLVFENDSILWNVGNTQHIFKININTKKYTSYTPKLDVTLGAVSFFDIKKWKDNEFLLASSHGLWSFNTLTQDFKNLSILNNKNNLSNQPIKQLLIEEDGGVWMATSKVGLFYKNFITNQVYQYTIENTNGNLASNVLFTIYKATNGAYCIGTNKGIVFMDPIKNSFITFDSSDGIASDAVIGIQENKEGIWFSSHNGLTCYHYKDKLFYNFYEKDGLPHNEFNQQSFFKDKNDAIYFGGLNGGIRFKERNFSFKKPNTILKPVSIEYYDIDKDSNITRTLNLPTSFENIELPPDKNFITITYALTDPFNTNAATYEYKLEGLNDDWISLKNSNELRLYGLPPGNFKIIIRGVDVSGNSALNTIEVPIFVNQIFYKKTWFIVFGFILFFLLLLAFLIFRHYRWNEKFEQQRKVDQLESKALRAQMNPHFMFNALNGLQSTMFLKGEREVNKYLGSFSKLLRASIDMSKSDTISLKEEITYLEAYLNLEKLRQAKPLETSITIVPENINLKRVKLPCMLFQPLLENAILHGLSPKKEGGGKLNITFIKDQNTITGIVEDNGIGREAAIILKNKNRKTHKSWATIIMEERIEIINKYADYNVYFHIEDLYENGKASGTRVTLRIPLF